MKVEFYGHVRQYHNLKAEIDAAILEVLESGKYVMGPTLERFEKELAAYFKMKYAIGCN
jgi:UDP-2-acetamido-2-deoxy-ribo-hexuluronate aminotransferase